METRHVSVQKRKVHSVAPENIEEIKTHRFMTGSTYKGQWNKFLNCMDGFGIYTYPDGTEYRGFFKNGLFHGYGRVTLAEPYKLIFSGTFEAGQMVSKHEDMHFKDGLRFEATVQGDNVNTSNWRYLHWVYKQTCRDILDRNIDINARTCRNRVNPECKSNKRDYFKHYTPDVCAQGSSWHDRNPDEMSVCMSGDTSVESLSCKQLADQTLLEACKAPEIDDINESSTSTKAINDEEHFEEELTSSSSEPVRPLKINYVQRAR